jgi:hypothetical protein
MGTMSLAPIAPSPTVTLGISIPDNLRHEIITAVPPSILVQLMNHSYRSSVASDFQAGNTPSWYDVSSSKVPKSVDNILTSLQNLEPNVKTFFEGMASDIQGGSAVFTRTSTPTAEPSAEGEAPATSTSSDFAQPTGADRSVMVGAIGMAGVLGVALAL